MKFYSQKTCGKFVQLITQFVFCFFFSLSTNTLWPWHNGNNVINALASFTSITRDYTQDVALLNGKMTNKRQKHIIFVWREKCSRSFRGSLIYELHEETKTQSRRLASSSLKCALLRCTGFLFTELAHLKK